MTTYVVYSYYFSGRCVVDTVEAESKQAAKFRVLRMLGVKLSNEIQRQVAEEVA